MNSLGRRFFPDPNLANDDGIVLIDDELSVEILCEAYEMGIFPWPHEDLPILWFSPDPRGVLKFSDFHMSKSLLKQIRKFDYRVSFNRAFEDVIIGCAESKRSDQSGTWISEHIINNYIEFHRAGYAHSIECWDNKELVGGIYGVYVNGVFSGESMFFRRANASKICLAHLINFLSHLGHKWMDIQMVTPHLKSVGGKYISRKKYLELLREAQSKSSFGKKLSVERAYLSSDDLLLK